MFFFSKLITEPGINYLRAKYDSLSGSFPLIEIEIKKKKNIRIGTLQVVTMYVHTSPYAYIRICRNDVRVSTFFFFFFSKLCRTYC